MNIFENTVYMTIGLFTLLLFVEFIKYLRKQDKRCKDCKWGKLRGNKNECYRVYCIILEQEMGLYDYCSKFYTPKWYIKFMFWTLKAEVKEPAKCPNCGLPFSDWFWWPLKGNYCWPCFNRTGKFYVRRPK